MSEKVAACLLNRSSQLQVRDTFVGIHTTKSPDGELILQQSANASIGFASWTFVQGPIGAKENAETAGRRILAEEYNLTGWDAAISLKLHECLVSVPECSRKTLAFDAQRLHMYLVISNRYMQPNPEKVSGLRIVSNREDLERALADTREEKVRAYMRALSAATRVMRSLRKYDIEINFWNGSEAVKPSVHPFTSFAPA